MALGMAVGGSLLLSMPATMTGIIKKKKKLNKSSVF